MKITFLSKKDYGGSAFRWVKAIGGDARLFIIEPNNFGVEGGTLVSDYGWEKLQSRIDQSDIVHIKGDWAYPDEIWESHIDLRGKMKVATVCGSGFRRGNYPPNVAHAWHLPEEYVANLRTAITPDIAIDGFIFTPHAWNSFEYCFRPAHKFRIVHIPSDGVKKGSRIVGDAINLLMQKPAGKYINYTALSRIPNRDVLEVKRISHIYLDQFIIPSYGNAGIEAMAMGIPLVNYCMNYPDKVPVVNAGSFDQAPTARSLATAIENILDWRILRGISEAQYEYCRKTHGEMGRVWRGIYRQLLN
jgi:hypothetical protein